MKFNEQVTFPKVVYSFLPGMAERHYLLLKNPVAYL